MMSYFVATGSPGMPMRRMVLVATSLASVVLIGAEVARETVELSRGTGLFRDGLHLYGDRNRIRAGVAASMLAPPTGALAR